jgi:predicted site-specific integrase-resolvase
MSAAEIAVGQPTRGEFIGLYEAVERYNVPYSSLRAWVKSGLIPSWSTPNRRVWLRPEDIETKLFRPVQPETQPTQGE